MTLHPCRICGEYETAALFCEHCRDRALAHLGWTIDDIESNEDVVLVYRYANRLLHGDLAETGTKDPTENGHVGREQHVDPLD